MLFQLPSTQPVCPIDYIRSFENNHQPAKTVVIIHAFKAFSKIKLNEMMVCVPAEATFILSKRCFSPRDMWTSRASRCDSILPSSKRNPRCNSNIVTAFESWIVSHHPKHLQPHPRMGCIAVKSSQLPYSTHHDVVHAGSMIGIHLLYPRDVIHVEFWIRPHYIITR